MVALWARAQGISLDLRNRTLPGGLLAGATFAAEFACIYWGLQYADASRMIVFIYLAPFVVALGMPLVARSERPSAAQLAGLAGLAGLAVAFSGVAWAFAEGLTGSAALGHEKRWLRDALGVLASLLLLHEPLTLRLAVACATVALGIALVSRAPARLSPAGSAAGARRT
jgi:drug/metabolite transporter (DMT)-like permease